MYIRTGIQNRVRRDLHFSARIDPIANEKHGTCKRFEADHPLFDVGQIKNFYLTEIATKIAHEKYYNNTKRTFLRSEKKGYSSNAL